MRPAIAILAAFSAFAAPAGSPRTAREIMQEVERRSFSKTFRYEGRVTVRKASGAVERKTWEYERFGPPGNSKVLLRFRNPAEIRGVGLLIWNNPQKSADMWLYTPAIARTRRIAHQDRSNRFAGTGFTFEDLEEADISQWAHRRPPQFRPPGPRRSRRAVDLPDQGHPGPHRQVPRRSP